MLEVYYWQRVAITIDVERVIAYPDTEAEGEPAVYGARFPSRRRPRSRPAAGPRPRVDSAKLLAQAQKLPHTLVGLACDPTTCPTSGRHARWRRRRAACGWMSRADPCLEGGRRAGLTAHAFEPRMVGQEQRVHTGWLEADGDDRPLLAAHEGRLQAPRFRTSPSRSGSASLAFRMKKARAAGLVE